MKKSKNKKTAIGEEKYLNKNCWLVQSLNHAPYSRCQHCELKFRNCQFLHYQVISLILATLFIALSFFIKGKSSELVIIAVFTLVIVYGYFFNKSTDKIIRANFTQRQANEKLEELTANLQQEVDKQVSEIKKLLKTKKELLDMKLDFLQIVSHQLRTPVAIFYGLLDNWKTGEIKDYSKEEQEKIMKNTIAGANRLKNTINDMLDALERGMEFEFKPVDISSILDEISEMLKPNYDQKGLYLEIEKTKEKLPKIQASERFIKDALMNLLDNAEKYTDKGGVKVNLEKEKNNIMIKIADTGMGLMKDEGEKIFQTQFFRSSRAIDRVPDGSGLGLYIAKQIIEKHNGKIEAKSQGLHKGTTFTIVLPIWQK